MEDLYSYLRAKAVTSSTPLKVVDKKGRSATLTLNGTTEKEDAEAWSRLASNQLTETVRVTASKAEDGRVSSKPRFELTPDGTAEFITDANGGAKPKRGRNRTAEPEAAAVNGNGETK